MKKGNMITGWIIILLIFFMLAFIVYKPIYANVNDVDVEQKRCAADIKTSAKISYLSKGTRATAIDCPTKEIIIEEKLDDEEVKRKIAQEMVECHELWGSGELILFGEEKGIYCHKCNIIEFESKEPLEGFNEFLFTEPGKNSYMNQLNIQNKESDFGKSIKELDNGVKAIDRTKKYTTIFVYAKGEAQIDNLIANFGANTLEKGIGTLTVVTTGGVAVCVVTAGLGCMVGVAGVGLVAMANYVIDFFNANPPEFASATVLRELSEESVEELGCTLSFASS